MMRLGRRARLLGLLAALSCAGAAAAGGAVGAAAGGDCDPTFKVVAHGPDAKPLRRQPQRRPVICISTTGFPGSETDIAVSSSGALVFAHTILPVAGVAWPHFVGNEVANGGLAISTNRGASWRGVQPPGIDGQSHPTYKPLDDHLYVDKDTSRVFWNTTGTAESGSGNTISYTDDDGATWGFSTAGLRAAENARITSGRPRGSRTVGYPKVVYFCFNTSLAGGIEPVGGGRLCAKSLDGGATWILLGQGILFRKVLPAHAECGTDQEDFGPLDGKYPQPTRDGRLYVVLTCGDHRYLAVSSDEGTSWPLVTTGGHSVTVPGDGQFLIDGRDRFYALWKDVRGRVVYAFSADRGRTWSRPRGVLAPGVEEVFTWQAAIGGPGELLVTYYGRRPGRTTYDGFLTQTRDAFAAVPTFWSGMANRPSSPLLYRAGGVNPGILYDYNGAAVGPDGSGWAGFVKDCGAALTDQACRDRVPTRTTVPNDGYVAELRWPR
jgi:hypothetical protein